MRVRLAVLVLLISLAPAAHAKKFRYASGPKPAADTVLSVADVEVTPVVRARGPRVAATNLQLATLVANTAVERAMRSMPLDSGTRVLLAPAESHPLNFVMEHAVLRQLTQRGIPYEALDNGILSCAEPRRLQALCDGLSADTIDAFFRKWLERLPHPFTPADHRAGYRYELSILQAEFSLTQVLDRPLSGRLLFEDLIRENLDLGRPDRVQLIFDRRVTRQTPGRFCTRVVTEGVVPSLHVSYKHSNLKQYLKGLRFAAAGRALRNELTVNDTRDFEIGRGLRNLAALRQVGFQATRRLLDVQRLSCDATIGEGTVEHVHRPVTVAGQRAPGLRFLDPRVLALFMALVVFRLLPRGFSARELRQHVAPLLGKAPPELSLGQLTYDLRRLRLHGLIERLPKQHRYRVTDAGLRIALFVPRLWARTLRPGLATVLPDTAPNDSTLRRAFERVEHAMDDWCAQAKLAA